MAKDMGHGSHKATMVIGGILLVILGVMLWTGRWNLERTLSALLVLWGIKKLYWSMQKDCWC